MEAKVNRTYKDSLFRKIFDGGEGRGNLLSLYNAVNGTDYADPEELVCITIEDVIYMGMKNDTAFLLDCRMNLFEQQSSFNPNMPLRGFMYAGRLYEKILSKIRQRLYGTTLVKIPAPGYLVFYNGEAGKPDIMKLKLSDAFEVPDSSGEFQWTATMININSGHNRELMEKCRPLMEYTVFVDRVRACRKSMELEEAVEKAVRECISEGIMAEFLTGHRAEVLEVILCEYDENEVRDWLREEAMAEGLAEGLERGKELGLERGKELGLEQGKELGLEQGKELGLEQGKELGLEQKAIEDARNFKKAGVEVKTIAECVGLPVEEVEAL